MSQLALTYITMNAGDGIPGSILKFCLNKLHQHVDYCVVVDGNLTPQAKEYYNTIPNIKVVDSPWTGRHVDQYHARNQAIPLGDWVLCMDCDELPSDNLINVGKHLIHNPHLPYNICYSPSITYLAIDSSNTFIRIQEPPTEEDFPRRSKRLLYRRQENNYFISSPCGKHVTPTHVKGNNLDEVAVGSKDYIHYHCKTIESFILNECIYVLSNPKHEAGPQARLLTQEQENTLVDLVAKYALKNTSKFIDMTKNGQWPSDFKDFVYQFKHHLGQSMSKFYYLYEFLRKKDFSNIKDLISCISLGFIPVYDSVINKETPIVIPRTPSIWQ